MRRPSTPTRTPSPVRLLALLALPLAIGCSGNTDTPTPSATEPGPTATQPPETATQPTGTATAPDVTATAPDVTGTAPDVTGTEPDVTGTEPDITGTEPDVTGTEPDVTGTPTMPTPTETMAGTDIPISDPNEGDVIITELQPSPRIVSDGDGEWIEIHNVTDKTFDISSWQFSIQTAGQDDPEIYTFDAVGAVYLGPDESAVIANNGNLSENGNIPADAITSFFMSGLGFTAVLETANQTFIDEVIFNPDTTPFIEGHSIALSGDQYDTASNDSDANWCVSFDAITNSTDFGTPGAHNPDCGADNDGDLYHGEYDCNDEAAEINPGTPDFADNTTDDDCDGNVDEGPAVEAGSVVITEFLYNPSGDERVQEWVEIYNTTEEPIDLMGFAFADSAQSHVINSSVVVPALGFVVLGSSTDLTLNGGAPVAYDIPDLGLNNGGDSILLSYDNILVDGLAYASSDGWPSADGQSLSLDPRRFNHIDNDSPDYWCKGEGVYRTFDGDGTGEPTDAPVEEDRDPTCKDEQDNDEDGWTDIADPDCAFDGPESNATDIRFECNDGRDNDGDGHTDADDDDCIDAYGNEGGDFGTPGEMNPECDLDNDGDGFRPDLDCDDTDAGVYPGQIEDPENSKDDNCNGQVDEAIPESKAIIITEIMYDPSPPGDSVGEYLELYNTTDAAVNLDGWKLDDNNSSVTFEGELIVPAKGYAILGRSSDTSVNGNITVDYVISLALGNSGDSLTLFDGDENTVDSVSYTANYDEGGWPTKQAGYSIQLGLPAYNSELNDSGYYWCFSTAEFGPDGGEVQYGTPGADNRDCRPNL